MNITAIAPYRAEFQTFKSNAAGGMDATWQPCRVVGYVASEGDEPAYLVEVTQNAKSHLRVVETVRHPAPTPSGY